MSASSGDDFLRGTQFTDTIDPQGGNDVVWGNGGSDHLFASPGNDTIYGYYGDYTGFEGGAPDLSKPDGVDTVFYTSARSEVTLSGVDLMGYWGSVNIHAARGWQTDSALEGRETMIQVERLVFANNEATALDFNYQYSQQNGARAVKLVAAVFGADAIHNEDAVGIALSLVDMGKTDMEIAQLGLDYLGLTDPADVVSLLWSNVVGAPMDDYYLGQIVALFEGGMTSAEFAVLASDTKLNTDKIKLTGAAPGEALSDTGLAYHFYPAAVDPVVTRVVGAPASEGSVQHFSVTLSTPATQSITFSAGTLPGVASDADWGQLTSGTARVHVSDGEVTIEAGILEFQLDLPMVDDAMVEGDESFELVVGGVSGSSQVLDNDGPVFVRSMSNPDYPSHLTTPEGSDSIYRVALSHATQEVTYLPFSIENYSFARVHYADSWTGVDFTAGVTPVGDELAVPAGVSQFDVVVHTRSDDFYAGKGVKITVGAVHDARSIDEREPNPPNEEHFFLGGYEDMGQFMWLDTFESGPLSVAQLRSAVIAQTSEEAYWKLFDLDVVHGPHDSTWTPSEMGAWDISYLSATQATLESLAFGTHLAMLYGLNSADQAELSDFVARNQAQLASGDQGAQSAYVDRIGWLMQEPFSDRPGFDYATETISFFTHLVQIVGAGGNVDMMDFMPIPQP